MAGLVLGKQGAPDTRLLDTPQSHRPQWLNRHLPELSRRGKRAATRPKPNLTHDFNDCNEDKMPRYVAHLLVTDVHFIS